MILGRESEGDNEQILIAQVFEVNNEGYNVLAVAGRGGRGGRCSSSAKVGIELAL